MDPITAEDIVQIDFWSSFRTDDTLSFPISEETLQLESKFQLDTLDDDTLSQFPAVHCCGRASAANCSCL